MCRFALQLEVGMPDAKQREAILRLYLRKQAAESRFFEGSVTIEEDLLLVKFLPSLLITSLFLVLFSSCCHRFLNFMSLVSLTFAFQD